MRTHIAKLRMTFSGTSRSSQQPQTTNPAPNTPADWPTVPEFSTIFWLVDKGKDRQVSSSASITKPGSSPEAFHYVDGKKPDASLMVGFQSTPTW